MSRRLSELSPRWSVDADIVVGGEVLRDNDRQGMGLSFVCPCCAHRPDAVRLGVFFANPVDGKPPSDSAARLWTRVAGTSFEDLSISPSIDASERGHAHVVITNGWVLP